MAEFKGILFDYGHTLVWFPRLDRTHLAATRNTRKVLQELGVAVEDSKLQSLVESFAHRKSGDVVSMEEEFKEIFASLGIKEYKPNKLKEAIWAWWTPFIRNVRARRGLNELLEYLRKMRFKVGIVANVWSEGMNPVLERLRIKRFFDTMISSINIGIQKPEPRIFQLALNHLELAPEEVLMVGDNPRVDIKAAYDLGIGTARLMRGPNRAKPDIVEPNFKIRNLSTLATIVRKPNPHTQHRLKTAIAQRNKRESK